MVIACAAAAAQAQEVAPEQPTRPKDVAALFAQFRAMRGMSASYTEEKHLSLLAVPLTSSGKLHYMTDRDGENGRLVRVVEKPDPSKLTVTERELRVTDRRGTQVIDLRQSDRVRLFVTSLMQVFRGDRKSLEHHYDVRYAVDGAKPRAWRLDLSPKKEPLDKILTKLTLHGEGPAVTKIVLQEPSGDRTVTRVVKVDPKRAFSAAERLKIFGLRPDTQGGPRK